jgi:hypothetical protein
MEQWSLPAAGTGLLIVDMQEKFRPAIPAFDAICSSAVKLVRGFTLLGLPVLVTEQYPAGLGHTVAELSTFLPALQV